MNKLLTILLLLLTGCTQPANIEKPIILDKQEITEAQYFGGGSTVETVILDQNPGTLNQTWVVPSDFSSIVKVECVGSGGDGGTNATVTAPSQGGTGGAYASTTNIALSAGMNVSYTIGASATSTTNFGMWNETYLNSSASSTASLSCRFGRKGGGASAAGKLGGEAGYSTPATITATGGSYSGGPAGTVSNNGRPGNGGGGAGGPYSIGKQGVAGSTTAGRGGSGGGGAGGTSSTNGSTTITTDGGNGGQGTDGTGQGIGGSGAGGDATAGVGGGGAGGAGATGAPSNAFNGGNGSMHTIFDSTHGPGGGGGGGGATTSASMAGGNGGNAGTYGGGGGGKGSGGTDSSNASFGLGGQGIIVITYNTTADTCTYSGTGNWDVLQGDNCYITTSVYVNGAFNLIGSSTGMFGCAPGITVSAKGFNFGTTGGNTIMDAKCIQYHQ